MASETFGSRNFAEEATAGLESVRSVDDFCRDWQARWRPIVITAQGILQFLYPPGARVLGYVIEVVDRCCASPQKS